jgi:hypothetical protein
MNIRGVMPPRRWCVEGTEATAGDVDLAPEIVAGQADVVPAQRDHMLQVPGPISNSRKGEGFRAPALCTTVERGAGPAFGSLPRRKPRGVQGAVSRGARYGDL